MPTELELDHFFWNALRSNPQFLDWFVSQTKFKGRSLELQTSELWHQRWYRNPIDGKDSETDITVFLRDLVSGESFAVHVENKTPHREWEIGQAEGYKARANNRMAKWGHVDCEVALLAPKTHIQTHPVEASHFHFCVTYEDVAAYVPEFRLASA